MVHRVATVIRAMVLYLQAIVAHHYRIIEEARNKGHVIVLAVVRIDLVRVRVHMKTQKEKDATNIHIDDIAVIIIPDNEGVVNEANDVLHQETIDAEANQTSVVATMIDQEN